MATRRPNVTHIVRAPESFLGRATLTRTGTLSRVSMLANPLANPVHSPRQTPEAAGGSEPTAARLALANDEAANAHRRPVAGRARQQGCTPASESVKYAADSQHTYRADRNPLRSSRPGWTRSAVAARSRAYSPQLTHLITTVIRDTAVEARDADN